MSTQLPLRASMGGGDEQRSVEDTVASAHAAELPHTNNTTSNLGPWTHKDALVESEHNLRAAATFGPFPLAAKGISSRRVYVSFARDHFFRGQGESEGEEGPLFSFS